MTQVAVHVETGGAPLLAGTLHGHRRGRAESATFTYAASYLAHPAARPLDPALPLFAGAHHTPLAAATFGVFADCAPDRWGRTLLRRSEQRAARDEGRTPRTLTELDLLLGVRDDLRQGDLRVRRGPGGGSGPFLADEEHGVPALTDLPGLLDLASRAEHDDVDLPDLLRLVRVGSSLGGARPKAHVRDADGALAIAKFPSAAHDTWDVMAWEKVVHDLASAAGVRVPPTRLLELAGRRVLVVQRFDRDGDGRRTGYVSAMTTLEAVDGDRRSYVEIAGVVEERSPRASEELEQLWRRIVVTVLVSNTDDHLRNHGFLHVGHGAWELSPAFDVNPNPDPAARHLSTAIDDDDDEAALALALRVAPLFRLPAQRAREVLREVAAAVRRWPQVAAAHGLDAAARSAMAPAFRRLDDVG